MKTTAAVALPQQRTPEQPPAAELRYVTLATHRRHRHQLVLDNVNVTIHRGEVMSVLSRHDAAASTLLDLLDGRAEPSWGSVQVAGRELTRFRGNASGRPSVAAPSWAAPAPTIWYSGAKVTPPRRRSSMSPHP